MATKKQPAPTPAEKRSRGSRKTPKAAGPAARAAPEQHDAKAADHASAAVGIGASAGGLDAFKRLFNAMPADTGMAFVLIQHLDPNHPSLTAELLSKQTTMPVVQATDGMRVLPNHVCVIPPNKYLAISGGTLRLSEPLERRGLRLPIDFFFRSLADDQRERAIGIILTGTGSDGSLGLREIKAAGGMVIVQEPETAQHDGMVTSAIATGLVDHVLSIDQIPDVLIRYLRHWYVNGGDGQPPAAEPAPDHLTAILSLLRARVKYDFSCYKKGTLTRRVQRRMGLSHIHTMGEYVALLRENGDEVLALYKDLLIGVTNFFREPEAWEELKKQVIVPLVAECPPEGPIRAWIPGCATGEEPYSVAIILSEALSAVEKTCPIQVFASDIDQEALAFARAGIYPENIAADVSAERLRHFFIKGDRTYRINKEIRETVVFAEQNLISDPPFSKLDLISCRNLMIYLEADVQKKILAMFHFSLCEGGHLFLGNSETIDQQQDLFRPVSRKWRIYRRVSLTQPQKVELPIKPAGAARPAPETSERLGQRRSQRLMAVVQQHILQRFAPACALINRKAEVLYLNGDLNDFLQLPSGELATDLIAIARPALRAHLRSAVRTAIHEGRTVSIAPMSVAPDHDKSRVGITVEPLSRAGDGDDLLLV
ncbi:MAG TPA: chemotaxis protein CheB, partial [Pirellulales bacterium]|nr:chemotaxis protein CheB [Pirellulales bacterium]